MINEIKNFFHDNKAYVTRRKFLKDNYPTILERVENSKYKFAKALYHELYGYHIPLCQNCSSPSKFDSFDHGYKPFCSIKCSHSHSTTVNKRRNTNLQKRGVSNPGKCQDVKEKRQKTMVERYGVAHALQNKEIKEKTAQSFKITWMNKREEINLKRKETIKKNWNVENLWNSNDFRQRVKESNNAKWGTDWVQQNTDILNKRIFSRRQNMINALQKRYPKLELLTTVDSYTGINRSQGGASYNWKCKDCGNVFTDYISFTHWPICRKCYPIVGNSTGENELCGFLDELGIKYYRNDRMLIHPKEIDILIPEHRLAIEYNGLYWHSTNKIADKNYHYEKWRLCYEQGYQLITIFEDEWIFKKNICKNKIKHLLQRNSKICGARQCEINLLTPQKTKQFLNNYHIQGAINSGIKLGAFYDNELVGVMTFSKLRRPLGYKVQKIDEYELTRFVTKDSIPGLGNKMFKHFTRNYKPNRIISYCDLRWGHGKFYEMLGMTLKKITEPNYWYSPDGWQREYRFNYTKNSLVRAGYESTSTEKEIMRERGFLRIYDCGAKLFEWGN